jgi:hypothetical protein
VPRLPLLSAILLLTPLAAHAQQTDEQLWLQANGATSLGGGVKLTLEGIARFGNAADGLAHTEFGGQIAYKLSPTVEIAGGYRHVQDYNHDRVVPNEERLRQMVTIGLGGGFSGRLRLEERFSSAGPGVSVRIRPRLGYTTGLNGKGLALFATHEDFLNLNSTGWGIASGYERMRHTLGLTIPLSHRLKADAGYLNEYRFGRGSARDQMMHAATLTLNIEL